MPVRQRRLPLDEHARRGRAIYEATVRSQVEAGNRGKIVAIDIDTGEFELGDSMLDACHRLFGRLPDAQPWCERIGYRGVHKFGLRRFISAQIAGPRC